jgi:type I restriction enzyme M protein
MSRISQSQLESYLWGAAEHLRGSIDAGDYKQFIFPLLFLKRLCDVHDEETAQALRASGGDAEFAAFAENHRFQVPPEAHWKEIRKETRNVGQAIQRAMRAIESANKDKLFGIFGDAQWSNKDRLSDETMRELVEHFSSLDLTIGNLPEDELGQGYEFLIKKFADDSGHTAAEFYTNRTVVHLMTEMLDVQPGESVYDPTCGSGGMLMSCVAHLRKQGKEWRNVRLFGQERNLMTSSIARMNCFLHGIEDFRIERGDTLAEPKLVEGDKLMQFDVVLANPPYSIKQWDREAFRSDPWGRNLFGVPPQGRADYAFQQHINKSLKAKTGRCAVLWPHGVLFRNEEQEIREKMVEADLIECVIGLGPNLFYNSAMDSCIMICRSSKPSERRGKVLMIDARELVTRERTQSFLTGQHIQQILSTYRDFKSIAGFSKVILREDARQNDYSLSIPLYISRPKTDGSSEGEALGLSLKELRDTSKNLKRSLSKLGLGFPIDTLEDVNDLRLPDWISFKKGWNRVKLGDVVRQVKSRISGDNYEGIVDYVPGGGISQTDFRITQWCPVGDGLMGPAFHMKFGAGHVLYKSRVPHGVAVAERRGICANTTYVIEAISDQFDQKLLPFILSTNKFRQFEVDNNRGSTNLFLNFSDLANYEFDLPPLDQQQRLAEILWALEKAATSAELQKIAIKSALLSTARRNILPTGYDLNKPSFKDKTLSGYVNQNAEDLYEVLSGNGEPLKSEVGSALFFKVSDFNLNADEQHLEKGGTLFDPSLNTKIRVLPPGTILFPKRGASIFLNKVGIARRPLALDPNLMGLVPNQDLVRSEYLYWLIKLTDIGKIADTTSVPQLNHKHLTPLTFPVPNIELQDEILTRIKILRDAESNCKNLTSDMRQLSTKLINTL